MARPVRRVQYLREPRPGLRRTGSNTSTSSTRTVSTPRQPLEGRWAPATAVQQGKALYAGISTPPEKTSEAAGILRGLGVPL